MRRRLKLACCCSVLLLASATAAATSAPALGRVLFVGNSFFYGALSVAETYRTDAVHDLNGSGRGGVPAIVRTLADEAGRTIDVSAETVPGAGFDEHYEHRRALIDAPWDAVVMSSYSTLDREHPGDPAQLLRYTPLLARMFTCRNAAVRLYLNATWTRPDQTYPPAGHWAGRDVHAMAEEVAAGYAQAYAAEPRIRAVVQTGAAFSAAIDTGIALANPYAPAPAGSVDLWAEDHYHASAAGYYLEALMIYAALSGDDPARFGAGEGAAAALGLSPALTQALQQVAHTQALRDPVPAPRTTAAGLCN